MAVVEIIKPVNRFVNEETKEVIRKKRVCAYARVSTDDEDQVNSYRVQVDEYTKRIQENPSWEFIGVYADLGLSGTTMKKRPEFMKMIGSVRKGEIDLILVKSISRFARNVVDIVSLVHEFRTLGCVIFFEKENMYSDDPKADFTLSVLSSMAQEESRSISTNVKWSLEKKFKNGNIHRTKVYGYDFGIGADDLVINEEQAEVVRMIFSLFVQGYNGNDIKKILDDRKISSRDGSVWRYSSIRNILANEKYCGDAMCQKTITEDYLTHKAVKNDNRATKYLVRDHHPAIISRDVFEVAKSLLEKGQSKEKNIVTKYPLTNLVYCGECHRNMHRHHVNSGRPSSKVILDCRHNPIQESTCSGLTINADLVINTIKHAINDLISRKEIVGRLIFEISKSLDNEKLNDELLALNEKLSKVISSKSLADEVDIPSILADERSIKERITAIRKSISANHRNISVINCFEDLKNGWDLVNDVLFIKTLCQLIIFDSDKIIIVISKNETTDELIPYIESLKKQPEILRGFYSQYDKHIGLGYKVVYHE